jgi:two-component system CheB/CheR fusion protein
MLERVFDLFVQSHSTLDRAEGGMGVGLTLVRTLVGMHGGRVLARSDGDGKGSEFVVHLPLSPNTPLAEPDTASPVARERKLTGSRVVVIEDNEDIREALCELLDAAGFECRTASDGASGLALIDEASPDVAIIDIGLPQMTGLDLARHIRADPRHADVYLIALTGYGQPADRADALAAGFDQHVVKPIDSDALVRLLDEARERDSRLVN